MGVASLSIMLVEVIELLYYAKARDVIAIRMGTSGGLGMQPGTLLISSGCVNGELVEGHTQWILGEKAGIYSQVSLVIKFPSKFSLAV